MRLHATEGEGVEGRDEQEEKKNGQRSWINQKYFDVRPPLWSSGQSPRPQIQRPGFDSRHYQKKK
jgi:hypothetical protein